MRNVPLAALWVVLALVCTAPDAEAQTACGGCRSTTSDLTAGTSGDWSVSILITEERNGTCRDPGCNQFRGCKVTFSVKLTDGSDPFEDGEIEIEAAEVDPGVSIDDLEPEDWEDEGAHRTDETGTASEITQKTSCDKKTFLKAVFQEPALASVTLECGECDNQVEAGAVTSH